MNTNRKMMACPIRCLMAVVMTSAAALFPVHTASAAVIDTTGGTTVLNFDNPANTYIGNGVLQVSGDADSTIWLATGDGTGVTNFEMTGGTIDILAGVKLVNGGWQKGVWTNNLASLNVSGAFDIWDGQPVRVDALSGNGMVTKGHGGNSPTILNVGVNNGSGEFSGVIADPQGTIALTKHGTGTQVFTGANTYTGATTISDGTLQIGAGGTSGTLGSGNVVNNGTLVFHRSNNITVANAITGAGSLRKDGSNEVILSGSNDYSGGTTVTGGLLRATDNTIGSGDLTLQGGGIFFNVSGGGGGVTADNNFQSAVTLGTGGGGFRAGWGAMTLSGQISGPGSLTIVNDNAVTLTNTGNSYEGNTIIGASGSGNNATLRLGASEVIPHGPGTGNLVFNPSSGGTATLELNGQTETVNALVSGGAGTSRITGAGTLTFGAADAGGSFAGHITSSPNTNLVKIGSGTQTLSGTLIDHFGSTTVSGGTLRFLDLDDLHSSQLVIATGAIAEFENSARTFNRFSATSIEGEGTFVKTGTGLLRTGNATNQFARWNMTGGLIDVREGEFRADWQNNDPVTGAWANNKASLNVEAGAFVSMVGGNHISVDAVSGAGTIQNINSWGVGVLTIGSNDGSGTFGGTMRDSGGVMALTKTGTGTQTLTGNNTYTGATTITGGTLMVDGTHTGGGRYTVRDGGTLGGTGIVGATVSIDAGGTHAPGASVGEQTLGDAVWNPGGAFEFEVNDALGTAGGPAGWDLATISSDYGAGTLDISNLTAGSFQIDILSLTDVSAGPIANFNPTVPNTWEFVTYDSLLGEFDPELFVLDDTDFRAHNTMGKGRFTILETDGGLAIGFIPEPGTLMLLAFGVLGLLVRRRRRA